MYKIAVMQGDGIGPEISNATVRVLKALEKKLKTHLYELHFLPIGLHAFHELGTTFPLETKEMISRCDGAILGPVTTHIYESDQMPNPSAKIRKEFDLFANLRPVRSIPGQNSKFNNIDLLIVRENTEGMYSDRNMYNSPGEVMTDEDTVISLRLITRKACDRIAQKAFEMAEIRNGKKKVSAIHKANVLKKGCGMFLESCISASKQFQEIEYENFHIDAFAMYLILHPENYDVIVTTNMFGDILSDEAAGLVGSLGLAPGLNVGDEFAVAQAAHGSSPSIAGKNMANPIAIILSAKMLLDWLAKKRADNILLCASEMMGHAVWSVLEEGKIKTPDIGGQSTTSEVCDAILEKIYLI
jgi:3-isopropylmalate dehydrogenase